jgi:transmembrane sensor
VEAEWHRLSNAIDQNEKTIHSVYWWKIAASLSALVFLTAFALLLVFKHSTIEVSTTYGEIKHVVMPDGSEVVLNANSTISYKNNWKDNSMREVWLTGEAFFDVRRKNTPASRFVVHSNHAYVEVMGTQFNVNNRRGETTVVLNTGKVVLKNDLQKDTIMMKPGDLVTLTPHRNQAIRQRVNPTVYSAWKDKKFIFNETPLTDITRLIEENFGMKVIVKSESLKNRKLSGEIMVDNINVLLEALSKTFDIRIVRDRNTITLEEKI